MTTDEYQLAKASTSETDKRMIAIKACIARMEKEIEKLSPSERILARKEIDTLYSQLWDEKTHNEQIINND